jgi:hypothetical protein
VTEVNANVEKTDKAHAAVSGLRVAIVLLFVCFSAGAAGESKRPGPLFGGWQLG